MNISFTQLINLICFIQVFAFCIFLVRTINKSKPNIYLALFFFAQLILVGRQLSGILFGKEISQYLYLISFPVFWIVVPTVLLYIQSMLIPSFRFTSKHMIHFIPSIIIMAYCIYYALQLHFKGFWTLPVINENHNIRIWKILLLIMYLYFFVYTLIALNIIKHFKIQTVNNKNLKIEKSITWLKIFVNGFFISWLINAIIVYSLQFNWLPEAFKLAPFMYILPFFLFFNIVFYLAWENPQFFLYYVEDRTNLISCQNNQKYIKLTDKLVEFMEIQKPYLDPELTVGKMSEQIKIPYKDLSRIINQNFNQNFNDFINYYRTKEVVGHLSNIDKLDTDLVSLALDCGFNSKASFFRVFKKNTGLTPKQCFKNPII